MNLREQLTELVHNAAELRRAREAEQLRIQRQLEENHRADGYRYAQESMDWVIQVIKDAASKGEFHYDWPLETTGSAFLSAYAKGHAQAIAEYMKEQDLGTSVLHTNSDDKSVFKHCIRIFWM
jgi:hypothetical protein